MIQSPLALLATISFLTWLAFRLDRSVPALSKLGASLLALIFGALLSNTGVVPATSPVYDAIVGPVTTLAIAWLLLSVDLRDLKLAGGPMLAAYGLAALGTALGAMVGAFAFATHFGEDAWKLAGTLTGTYTGGSVNFVAVGRGLDLPDALFVAANAADALTTGLWLGFTLLIPVYLGRFFRPAPASAFKVAEGSEPVHPFFERVPLSTLNLARLLGLGLILLMAAEWMGGLVPKVPSILWLTTFALIVGHMGVGRRTVGAFQLGNLALHFFFVVIGIYSRVADIMAVGVEVFYLTLLVVAVHGLVVFGGGRLLKIDVGSLAVASQAAVGGPSSALAVAVSREWRGLVLPGVMVGLLGYAVGNYLGFGVARIVQAMMAW